MKKEIRAKLRELGVYIVYLFGSKATGMTTPLSDIDIGIVVKDSKTLEDTRALYTVLYDIFQELYPAKKVDIVFLQKSPLPLQYYAIKEGKVLFEDDPRITADYESYVMNMNLDFKPVLEYFDKV
ncbi:MAG: nucleotidyltransferase domain-containing protein, partial [Nitrospinae bacterium]|nr:nucleotidyltransferase domain-containing protein [Nitrospinota bacterium]